MKVVWYSQCIPLFRPNFPIRRSPIFSKRHIQKRWRWMVDLFICCPIMTFYILLVIGSNPRFWLLQPNFCVGKVFVPDLIGSRNNAGREVCYNIPRANLEEDLCQFPTFCVDELQWIIRFQLTLEGFRFWKRMNMAHLPVDDPIPRVMEYITWRSR